MSRTCAKHGVVMGAVASRGRMVYQCPRCSAERSGVAVAPATHDGV